MANFLSLVLRTQQFTEVFLLMQKFNNRLKRHHELDCVHMLKKNV